MPHLRFPNGGQADLVTLEADRVSLRSTVASAPGTPLAGNLETGEVVRVKVHRCRKQDASFLIEGRLVDATRKLRDELAALIAAAKTSS